MIRVIQRRLIIPRGDTGIFTIPAMTQAEGAIGVFTIFDPITNTRIFQKQVEIEGENFNISFSHADTVNLKAGDYLWDIKFYKNPILADNKVIDGEEINSYYAAFQAPKCEIRETGDDFLMIEGQPAKIEDLNIILGATEAANAAKIAATEQAEIAAAKAEEAAAKLEEMMAAMPTKVSELENDSGYLQEETDPTVPAWAKAAEKPTYTAQEVGALPSDTFIPSKVSDLTDDSGHYTKPASGIPASDLEETYLTEHQDLSNYVQKTDYANTNEAGVVKVNALVGGISRDSDGYIKVVSANSSVVKTGENTIRVITPNRQHESTFYGLAKAAGSDEKDSELPVGQYTDAAKAAIQAMLNVPSTADIPTNVSELSNDAGYLTEHQDISGKANSADLAAVATSGSYEDLSDKPTIPEVPVQDVQVNGTSILENGVAIIPAASYSNGQASLGLVKAYGLGISVDSSGEIAIQKASDGQIKRGSGSWAPIVASNEHLAAFYGLAKAAGDTTQSQSDNAVGAYTDGAKTAIQTMLDVPSTSAVTSEIAAAIGNINSFDMAVVQELPTQDISTHTIYLVPKTGETNDVYDEYVYINNAWEMVGNTQIDLSNYVQKTDYATVNTGGIIKVANGSTSQAMENGGSVLINNTLYVIGAYNKRIKKGQDLAALVSAAYQNYATFYGLAKAAGHDEKDSTEPLGTYTPEAKGAIQKMLGVSDLIATEENNLVASKAYAIGDVFTANGKLYKATAAIAADAAIIPAVEGEEIAGANCTETNISENFIKNTDYATESSNGVVRIKDQYGIGTILSYNINTGVTEKYTGILSASSDKIKNGTELYNPIIPYRQHESVFYGLAKAAGDTTQKSSSNAIGTYTDSAKTAIKNMLGITQTLTVTVLTQDNVTVTGQTVTVRAVDSTGPIFATAAYEGQPVAFAVPSGFAYYVSVSDTLDHHFNPTTASGVITNTDVSVTLQYSDFSTIRTAADIKAALNANLDLTDLVGEQITCTKNGETLTWDVVDYDSTTGRIKLLLHDAFGTANMVFEPAQALMWCENGLAAGAYTFTWNTTQCYFTLTTAIPAGGQLRATNSQFQTYASQSATATLETGTVGTEEITGATDLGHDGQGLLNHRDRVNYGSNNFAESALFGWLNSNAAANTPRVPVTKFSRAYSYAQPGFMNGLDADFVNCLDEVDWLCSTNNVYECPESLGGYTKGIKQAYTVKAKFALASEMEIFGSYGGNPDGSTVFDLYNGADADDRKKYRGTSAQVWWLRSPNWVSAHSERSIYSSGSASSSYADGSYAVVPACQISRDSEVTE